VSRHFKQGLLIPKWSLKFPQKFDQPCASYNFSAKEHISLQIITMQFLYTRYTDNVTVTVQLVHVNSE